MAEATNQQIQNFVDQRVRPHCEQLRALLLTFQDDKSHMDDVYAALAPPATPTWTDGRTDGPPHLLVKDDVLGYNAFITSLIDDILNHPNFDQVMSACVRPVQG